MKITFHLGRISENNENQNVENSDSSLASSSSESGLSEGEIAEKINELEDGVQSGRYFVKQKTHGSNKRKLKAPIWQHFYEIFDSENENLIPSFLYCTECKHVLRNDYKHSNTNKLIRHECSKKKVNPLTHIDKENLKFAISRFVAVDNRPYSIVDGDGFKSLCGEVFELGKTHQNTLLSDFLNIIPCRNTIKKGVHEISEATRKIITEEINLAKDYKGISVAIDNWTDDYIKRTYFGVVVIIAYADKFGKITCKKFTLSVNEMEEIIKTKEVIAQHLYDVLRSYGLSESQVKERVKVISDRGSNVKYGIMDQGIEQLHCYAHIINNIVGKMLEEHDVKQLVEKASKLASYMKNYGHNKHLKTSIKTFSKTRWNSVCIMFKSIIDNYEDIVKVLTDIHTAHITKASRIGPTSSQSQRRSTDNERCGTDNALSYIGDLNIGQMSAYTDFLLKFKDISTTIEGHITPTLFMVWPAYLTLNKLMESSSILDACPYRDNVDQMRTIGRLYMQSNLRDFEPKKPHKIATILHPVYKSLAKISRDDRASAYNLIDEMLPEENVIIRQPEVQRPIPRTAAFLANFLRHDDDDDMELIHFSQPTVSSQRYRREHGIYKTEFQQYLNEDVLSYFNILI